MRLEDLQLLLVIADVLNLHRAAEASGLSQSAVTKSLRRIEDELGVRLFERAPRGLVLTEPGQSFVVRVRTLDLGLQEAVRELGDWRGSRTGLIRIGSTAAIIETILAPAIQQFLRHRPGARFELTVGPTAVILESLLDSALDLVAAIVPDRIPDDLDIRIVCQQKFQFVFRKGHALFDTPDATIADLAAARWMLEPKGRTKRQWVEAQLAAAGLPPPVVAVETDASAGLIASLIPNDDLVTLLNITPLGHMIGTRLVARDDILPPLIRPLAIYQRRGAYASPLIGDFKDVLYQMCARSGFAIEAETLAAMLPLPPQAQT